VDFCCRERYLVVELDGGQHANQAQTDQRRTDYLNKLGYRVLRFWDHEALADTDEVLQRIADAADGLRSPLPASGARGCFESPSPWPSPHRNGARDINF
jgi:very-short-patch-repair endonuclease